MHFYNLRRNEEDHIDYSIAVSLSLSCPLHAYIEPCILVAFTMFTRAILYPATILMVQTLLVVECYSWSISMRSLDNKTHTHTCMLLDVHVNTKQKLTIICEVGGNEASDLQLMSDFNVTE